MIAETSDAVDEGFGFLLFGMVEYLFRCTFLVHDTLVHVKDTGRDIAGETHLVGNDDHSHTFLGKTADNSQNLADHGGVESGCRLVKKNDFRFHSKASGYGDTLFLSS